MKPQTATQILEEIFRQEAIVRQQIFTIDVVDDEGKVVTKLNQKLLEQQKVSAEQLQNIKDLHVEKNNILTLMQEAVQDENNNRLRRLASIITEIEFDLQSNWNFKKDINYHRSFELPGCTCPLIDNNERYPTGNYIVNAGCPIHGDK